MGRVMDTTDIKELLYRNLEHPRWDDVAARCLSCTNCTLVCPTCFCESVEDVSDLTGTTAERWRRWDSCFTLDHSFLHGGSVRSTIRARYRQWLTHKVASWIDQYGTSGCVGCGRCITWCPVGIDITEEVAAIRATDGESVVGSQ
jgi:formate hydrogenlyase subunit 6/NADH:ubiquinone oxidoreductase subunit I